MSPAVSFKSVVVVTSQGVRLWTLSRKAWTESRVKLSLDTAPTAEAIALTQGSNLLVLVSDAFTGHLQFVAPNKKEALTDEALGERLQNDYQIDVGSYEFAMQRSTLTRTEIQVSVSGIEAAVYQQIQTLIAALQARKTWVMPFGWFLSPLKSVEPVLLGVVGPKDQVYISHHYLGVDDARELNLSELSDYVQSRKEERKETHLLYIQAPSRIFKKIESSLAELVAVHPLIAEASGDTLTDTITEVMSKGNDVLSELLHFDEGEGTVSELPVGGDIAAPEKIKTPDQEIVAPPSPALVAPVPMGATADVSEEDDDFEDAESDTAVTDELPQPRLPQPSLPVSSARTRVAVTAEVEEVIAEKPEKPVAPAEPVAPATKEEVLEVPASALAPAVAATVAEIAPDPQPVDALSRLAAEKSGNSAKTRYREVEKQRSWGVIALVFILVVAVTTLVGGAIFWSKQPQPQQNALIPSETQPTPTPVATPAPTPKPEGLTLAQKAQLNTTVLNATSRAGLAGRYQTELKKAGWNIPTAGNASGTYSESAVYVFTQNEAAFQTLSRELQGVSVRLMTENTEKTASSVDVVIVVNQPVEPKVTPADDAPEASGSATTR